MFGDKLRALLGSEEVIILSGGACACMAAYLLLCFLLRIYRAQKSASGEIVVTNTRPGLMRSFLPMARGLGMTLRALLHGSDPKSVYYRFANSVDRRLTAAGHPEGINADEFIGFGVLYGILWTSLVISGYTLLFPESVFSTDTLLLALGSFFVGCLLWRSWLSNKLNLRQTAIRRQLPFALDLLTLAMEAGLDFTSALARISGKTGNTPLGQEFSLMLHEIQLGKSRSDALRDFAARCDVQEVRTVVASMVQAEELGSSVGLVLRIQAAQQRERRSQLAEEKAMKAPVKMLFPMVFILAALLLIIGAPILLMFLNQGE